MSLQAALERRRAIETGQIWASEIPIGHGIRLFLGSGRDAENLTKLIENGVTHVLNVADDIPNFHGREVNRDGKRRFSYCNLDVTDFGGDAGISRVFGRAAAFVSSAGFVQQAVANSNSPPTGMLIRMRTGNLVRTDLNISKS